MLKTIRIKVARWILGNHCLCYQMGYHQLVDHSKTSIGCNNKSKK